MTAKANELAARLRSIADDYDRTKGREAQVLYDAADALSAPSEKKESAVMQEITRERRPDELVTIWVGGSSHSRTAEEWLELARRDLKNSSTQGEAKADIPLNERGEKTMKPATPYRPADWIEEELADGDRLCKAAGVQRTEGGRLPVQKIINALRTQSQYGRTEEVLRAELARARASYAKAVDCLTGIYALLNPPHVTGQDKTYRFENPHANETLQALSDAIRAIPDDLRTSSSIERRLCHVCGTALTPEGVCPPCADNRRHAAGGG